MGNFEKLSVLVIGVIIVMILVVALYTWTDDPAEPEATVPVTPVEQPAIAALSGDGSTTTSPGDETDGSGWLTWTEHPDGDLAPPTEVRLTEESELVADVDEGDEGEPSEPATATAEETYTVKPDQTLSHISLEVYGTTKHWPKIAERNNVDPARLRPGMVLIIPTIAAVAPADANKPAVASTGTGGGPRPGADYVVRSGDTIQKISQAAFGTIERWDDIWIRNLERIEDPRFLRTGMTLQIPN
jgi:nucleoid-associated protein YgaU